jgi:choline monooxygenase
MPPNEIYYDADFFREENRPGGVLRKFWTYVGHVSQFSSSTSEGKYITATLGHNLPILVTQAPDGSLRGFVNVCRHRAAVLLPRTAEEERGGGCGAFGRRIACPYHGWEYASDGRLAKAVQMKGVERFSPRDTALLPVQVARIGHLIFARAPDPAARGDGGGAALDTVDAAYPGLRELVQAAAPAPANATGGGGGGGGDGGGGGEEEGFEFVARHTYELDCNWKVFADNYLDGG